MRYAPLVPQVRVGPEKFNTPWGVTTEPSPSLFWFSTKPTPARAQIVISSSDGQVLARLEIRDSLTCGIQRLDLLKLGIKLEPGRTYRWTVRSVGSPVDGTGDEQGPETEAYLVRLPAKDASVAKIVEASGLDRAAVAGEQGVWYDMLETVCDLIDASPTDPNLRIARLQCLESQQANLSISAWIAGASGTPAK